MLELQKAVSTTRRDEVHISPDHLAESTGTSESLQSDHRLAYHTPVPRTTLLSDPTSSASTSSSHVASSPISWRPVFAALSDRDLLLYDTAPITREEWANPMKAHPLIATRLVQVGNWSQSPSSSVGDGGEQASSNTGKSDH
ncbi:unnamed protein product [Protopolystoma xenopodis]|uniref:Uncharacterized protein n=1 Tax=Protopolystoma xenopodis TaxID=117903 RepID=A0A448WGH2_9PLAT|nr:unnamed protein product [Protopolystoma xenopodis]